MDAKSAQPHGRPVPTPGLIRFQAWLLVNKKRVLIGSIIVLALGLAVGSAVTYQSQREIRASQALSEIKTPNSAALPPLPGTADAYMKVAREHKGTQAGGRALLLAGTTFFVQGQYDDAQKAFAQFARDYPASPFVPQALYGVATSLEAQKKPGDAIAKFEELRRRYAKSPVMDDTKLSLGRLYEEQDKLPQALDLYEELVRANQYTAIGSEAGLRMEDLLARHPELKKAPPTPIQVPTPGGPNSNVSVRMLTNRPPLNFSNMVRRTSSVPGMVLTNKAITTGAAPMRLNIK